MCELPAFYSSASTPHPDTDQDALTAWQAELRGATVTRLHFKFPFRAGIETRYRVFIFRRARVGTSIISGDEFTDRDEPPPSCKLASSATFFERWNIAELFDDSSDGRSFHTSGDDFD